MECRQRPTTAIPDDGVLVSAAPAPDPPNCGGVRRRWARREAATTAQKETETEEAAPTASAPEALQREPPDKRPGLGTSLRLRRGGLLPHLGLGGGSLLGSEGQEAVAAALRAGYRLIDTALYYGNERDIAAGIRLAGLRRDEVFICTKLLQKTHASLAKARASLEESLKNLGTGYVDLYLVHNPRAGRILQVWPWMLQIRDQGLARSVGVSNFGVAQLEGIREAGLEMPEVNQVELHCWLQQTELTEYHQKHSVATMCHAPLARCQKFGNTPLAAMAQRLGRSEAQLAIRWCLQRGLVPLPKSIQPERIRENAAEGFDLSVQDMEILGKLDCGYMSCKVATPCMQLPWSMVANDIPDPAVWGGNKGRGKGGKGKGQDSEPGKGKDKGKGKGNGELGRPGAGTGRGMR